MEKKTEQLQFGSGFAVKSYLEREVEEARRKKKTSAVLAAAILVFAALVIAGMILISTKFSVFGISSDVMAPALKSGDIIFARETQDVIAGDICCYTSRGKVIVRRVIAEGGSLIDVSADGLVTVDGNAISDSYGAPSTETVLPILVPEGSVFVLTDESLSELDEGSPVISCDRILGKAVFRIWPLGRFGSI